MSLLNENNTIFLIIDVQEKLLNAVFNKDIVSKNSGILAKAASILKIPTVITEQYPKGLGETVSEVKDSIGADVEIFEKNTFSALDNDEIKKFVKSKKRKQIVLFGIETHICVSQTAQALIEEGYEVFVIANACGSRDEGEYKYGLDRIKSAGGNVITAEIALFELLRGAKHPYFKEIQSLIK